jgi:peptide/nickel transport system substrate-binding protein
MRVRAIPLWPVWPIVAAIFFLTSCATSSPQTTAQPSKSTTPSPQTTVAPLTTAAGSDIPRYGGILNVLLTGDIQTFDEATGGMHTSTWSLHLTNEELLTGDWAKGPAGTGQFQHIYMGNTRFDSKTGSLAEKWEVPEPGHIIFKIRQGVHWGLNPNSEASRLVNGREFTADDVLFNLKRYTTEPMSYIFRQASATWAASTFTAPDKWTVDVRTPTDGFIWALCYLPDFISMMPPEVVRKYANMNDWRVSVGTGAFFLTDYVSFSSLTFARNPGYWDKDPVGSGKGNQLPYVDGVKMLIISDPSTQMAAVRTAKTDWMPAVEYDDFRSLTNNTPELKYLRFIAPYANGIYMRTDKPDLPFKDKRVRRALMMATDFKEMMDSAMAGDAELMGWPIPRAKEYENAYLPLEEASESVRELWTYNPQKAKQLLAEAGYPNGFKTRVICNASGGSFADQLSIFKAMWAKVGVDLVIEPKESGVYSNIMRARTHEEMIYEASGAVGTYVRLLRFVGPVMDNASFVDDPVINKAKIPLWDAYYRMDDAAVDRLYRELMKYVLDQAYGIPRPVAFQYVLWWPWLKNYHGETNVGNDNTYNWAKNIWIDQSLKEQMMGRR